MLGKSPIKWRQRTDKTIAVDWDVKHQFKQANIDASYTCNLTLIAHAVSEEMFEQYGNIHVYMYTCVLHRAPI